MDVSVDAGGDPQRLHFAAQFQLAFFAPKAFGRTIPNLSFNELVAALGNFAIYAAVACATVSASSQDVYVLVHDIAYYVRDSFDFNGSQDLGFWNRDDVFIRPSLREVTCHDVSAGTPLHLASNDVFNRWRRRNNRGGDFMI